MAVGSIACEGAAPSVGSAKICINIRNVNISVLKKWPLAASCAKAKRCGAFPLPRCAEYVFDIGKASIPVLRKWLAAAKRAQTK